MAVGRALVCNRESENAYDRYAVVVKKEGTIIGCLPQKLSRVCSLFLQRGGTIGCTVTGGRKYLADLVQGARQT